MNHWQPSWDFYDQPTEEQVVALKTLLHECELDNADAEQGYEQLRIGLEEIKEALDHGPLSRIHDVLKELGI